MKKLIILMAVSIMLTSCGKSAGLLNSDKKAGNNPPANNTSTINQPQKIDNDNIGQSWKGYAYDHMFAIGLILSVIAVCSVSVAKTGRPFKLFKNWFEVLKECFKNKFKSKNQPKTSSSSSSSSEKGEPNSNPIENSTHEND